MRKILLTSLLFFSLPIYSLSYSNLPRRGTDSGHSFCGTYPGRIYDELRKAKDLQRVIRARRSQQALIEMQGTNDSLEVLGFANPFDPANLDL
ncbi:MAG: hypothetical protein DMG06_22435 [Acidobacteria bacterium]|nr:MAG: hypothetical protein DMG06_22435 [Acidobacteriota bacterium]